MAWRASFPQSRLPASVEFSIKLACVWVSERERVSGRGTAAPVHKHHGKVPANAHNLTLVSATRLSIRLINIKTL